MRSTTRISTSRPNLSPFQHLQSHVSFAMPTCPLGNCLENSAVTWHENTSSASSYCLLPVCWQVAKVTFSFMSSMMCFESRCVLSHSSALAAPCLLGEHVVTSRLEMNKLLSNKWYCLPRNHSNKHGWPFLSSFSILQLQVAERQRGCCARQVIRHILPLHGGWRWSWNNHQRVMRNCNSYVATLLGLGLVSLNCSPWRGISDQFPGSMPYIAFFWHFFEKKAQGNHIISKTCDCTTEGLSRNT